MTDALGYDVPAGEHGTPCACCPGVRECLPACAGRPTPRS